MLKDRAALHVPGWTFPTTLLLFLEKLGFSESLKSCSQMVQVLVHCLFEDQDVIELTEAYLQLKLSQDSFHQSFKCDRSIAQSKRLDCESPRASSHSIKWSLVPAFLCELDLTKAWAKVHGWKKTWLHPSYPSSLVDWVRDSYPSVWPSSDWGSLCGNAVLHSSSWLRQLGLPLEILKA